VTPHEQYKLIEAVDRLRQAGAIIDFTPRGRMNIVLDVALTEAVTADTAAVP
jgi:hypothetical protein